jgi:hypothetical protein
MARKPRTALFWFPVGINELDELPMKKAEEMVDPDRDKPFMRILLNNFWFRSKGLAFGNSYFLPWDESTAVVLASKLHTVSATLVPIINALLEVGLFDRSIFGSYSVLTSRAIQEHYIVTQKNARRKYFYIEPRYNLLGKSSEEKKGMRRDYTPSAPPPVVPGVSSEENPDKRNKGGRKKAQKVSQTGVSSEVISPSRGKSPDKKEKSSEEILAIFRSKAPQQLHFFRRNADNFRNPPKKWDHIVYSTDSRTGKEGVQEGLLGKAGLKEETSESMAVRLFGPKSSEEMQLSSEEIKLWTQHGMKALRLPGFPASAPDFSSEDYEWIAKRIGVKSTANNFRVLVGFFWLLFVSEDYGQTRDQLGQTHFLDPQTLFRWGYAYIRHVYATGKFQKDTFDEFLQHIRFWMNTQRDLTVDADTVCTPSDPRFKSSASTKGGARARLPKATDDDLEKQYEYNPTTDV